MKHIGLVFGSLATITLAAFAAGAVACNGLLGIGSATVGEGNDAGLVEAGVNCAYYCQVIEQNCTGPDNTEYQGSLDLCLSMCSQLPADMGTIGDVSGNTLGCRINYAQKAGVSDATDNCRAAGPLGGGVCGAKSDACTNFCTLDVPYCAQQGFNSYVSITDCTNHCLSTGDSDAGVFSEGYVFVTDGGATGADLPVSGDTLNCRYYHLENAWPSKMKAMTHCPHTMPLSATCNHLGQ